MSPDPKRLFLGFFFLTTDVWNDISNHFRPVFERFSCSGNCLISSCHYFVWLKLFPCGENRCIRLDGAVWFYSNETALCAKSFSLISDHFHMFRIDLRYDHRHIRCPSVCTVVGYNRCLCLSVFFLDLFDLFFCHVHCGENKIYFCSNFFYFVDIHDNDLFYCFRHWSIHFPAVTNCLFICLTGTSWAGCDRCHLKPRMILQQRDESLSYHTCSTKNTYF